MARVRKAPDTPPDTTPPGAPEGAPAAAQPAEQGRKTDAGAKPPVVAKAQPLTIAGRKTEGGFVQGRRIAPSAQVDDSINMLASAHPNFILTHDRARWAFFPQCGKILPDFGKIRLVPGIGRVDSKGSPDAALVDAQKSGRSVIFDKQVPEGYLREYDMVGGKGFLCAWERVKRSGKDSSVVVDFGEYEAFAVMAIDMGLIEPPGEAAIEWLRRQAVNMIRLSESRKDRPSVAAEIKVYEAQIAACDALLSAP